MVVELELAQPGSLGAEACVTAMLCVALRGAAVRDDGVRIEDVGNGLHGKRQ
ncbi:hypothetical protein ABT299_46075 [Spirillospora sp. NPDC000708]